MWVTLVGFSETFDSTVTKLQGNVGTNTHSHGSKRNIMDSCNLSKTFTTDKNIIYKLDFQKSVTRIHTTLPMSLVTKMQKE